VGLHGLFWGETYYIVYDLFDDPFLKVVNPGLRPGLTNIKYTHEVYRTLKETNRSGEPTSKTSVKNRNDKRNEPSEDHTEYKVVDSEQRTVTHQYKIPHTSYQSIFLQKINTPAGMKRNVGELKRL
jgi:hypothetical protein